MNKIACLSIALLLTVGNATAQSLVGTYKLLSFTSKFEDGISYEFLGQQPVGYTVITPKLFTSVIASADRKPGSQEIQQMQNWRFSTHLFLIPVPIRLRVQN